MQSSFYGGEKRSRGTCAKCLLTLRWIVSFDSWWIGHFHIHINVHIAVFPGNGMFDSSGLIASTRRMGLLCASVPKSYEKNVVRSPIQDMFVGSANEINSFGSNGIWSILFFYAPQNVWVYCWWSILNDIRVALTVATLHRSLAAIVTRPNWFMTW